MCPFRRMVDDAYDVAGFDRNARHRAHIPERANRQHRRVVFGNYEGITVCPIVEWTFTEIF